MENVEVIEVRSDSDTEERTDFQTETVTVKSEILENVAESSGSNIASSSEDGENIEMDGETLLRWSCALKIPQKSIFGLKWVL